MSPKCVPKRRQAVGIEVTRGHSGEAGVSKSRRSKQAKNSGRPDSGEWPMIQALARRIVEGTDGRFYSQMRQYHHEGGMVYCVMSQRRRARH